MLSTEYRAPAAVKTMASKETPVDKGMVIRLHSEAR